MSRYRNKDIKMLVALLPTLKMLLSAEINSEVIEAAARSCSLKRVLSKICHKMSLLESLLRKIRLKEKKETLEQVFFREFC